MELLFRRHIKNVAERIGESNARQYAKAVDERLQTVLWITFVSLLLLTIMIVGLVGLKEETFSNFLVLVILILVYSVVHLFEIRKVGEETMYDEELTAKWRSVSLYTSLFGIICGLIAIYMMFSTFDISFRSGQEDEQTEERCEAYNVRYEKLGININVPEGWSEPQWEYKSEPSVKRPQYRFHITDPDHTLWFYVRGWLTQPGCDMSDLTPSWEKYIPTYLDDQIIDRMKLVELDGMQVLRAVGKRKDYPDYIYVCYQALHCSSRIDYTYSFRKTLPYKEELARADKFFKMIDFTDVKVPEISIEDTRPADWSFNDGCLDITSARVRMKFPDGKEPEWEEKTRSSYIFSTFLNGYEVDFNLRVVYTSESAQIMEFYEEFVEKMRERLNGGFEIDPCLKVLKNTKSLYAAGRKVESSGHTLVRYEIIHSGSRLCIETSVPSDLKLEHELKNIERLVETIEFY